MIEDKDLYLEDFRYYLKESYVHNNIANLCKVVNDETDGNCFTLHKRVIRRACDMLWDFIDQNAVDKMSSLYYANHNQSVLSTLKRALALQVEYFLQIGDTGNAVGMKLTDRVHKGAIQLLSGANFFNIKFTDLKPYEEW